MPPTWPRWPRSSTGGQTPTYHLLRTRVLALRDQGFKFCVRLFGSLVSRMVRSLRLGSESKRQHRGE